MTLTVSVEIVRQATTENIIFLLEKINGSPTVFAGLFPTLESRLGAEATVENCEELRFMQLNIIHGAITKYKKIMGGYLNEICVRL